MLRLPALAFCLLTGFAQASRIASPLWEAALPAALPHHGELIFQRALETRTGDFLVAGRDSSSGYLVRLSPEGKVRWTVKDGIFIGNRTQEAAGIFETSAGVATVWGCCGDLGWVAILHDDAGGMIRRQALGYPRGIYDVDPSGRLLMVSIGPGGAQQRAAIAVEGVDLAGGPPWTAALAQGRLDEVIGVRAAGDGSIAALDREGTLWGDTVLVWKLDHAGKILWKQSVPTGYKTAAQQGYHSIEWTQMAVDGQGRFFLAGIILNLDREESHPDSVAIAMLLADGTTQGVKRLPLHPGEPALKGFWSIDTLEAESDGLRLTFLHMGEKVHWRTGMLDWGGARLSEVRSSPEIPKGMTTWAAVPTRQGHFLGIGWKADGTGFAPGAPPQTGRKATALSIPVLLESDPQGSWSVQERREYADTLWTFWKDSPTGGIFSQNDAPAFRFLLPTRDGGALAGGLLWRREGKDSVFVPAVKIPPSPIGIFPIHRLGSPPPSPVRDGVLVDAKGRRSGNLRSPAFPGLLPTLLQGR